MFASQPGRAREAVLPGLTIAAVVAISFFPALRAGFVNFDDDVNFLTNPNYRGLGWAQLRWMFSDCTGHYMPVTWLTLGFDYLIWGMNPFGYHLTSFAFHAANAVLFGLVARVLLTFACPDRSDAVRRASVAAALFYAIHPLRV